MMKIVKFFGFGILIVIAIYFIAAAVSPSTVIIKAEIISDQPIEKVFKSANNFHHYAQWNAWSKMEPGAATAITGVGNQIGDTWAWDGDTIGRGILTKVAFEPNKSITNKLEFFEPEEWEGEAEDLWRFETTEDGKSKITWLYKQDSIEFMMRPMMGMMLNMAVKPQLDQGLASLVEHAATIAESRTGEIVVEEVEPMSYIGIKKHIKVENIGSTLGELYGQLSQYLEENNAQMAGMPMAFYHTWDFKETDMEAAIPVLSKLDGNDEIAYTTTDGGKVVSAIHYGTYESSGDSHMAIEKFMEENELVMNGPVCEIYLNDPSEVSPSEIQTKIIYPVR